MKKLVALALAVMLLVLLTACGAAAKTGDAAAMPASSKDLKGEDFQDVVTSLRSAGFTNVTTATIDDLIVGWLTKDGEVEKVSVNGATDFQANSSFPKDAEIVVTYHTFPTEPTDATEGSTVTTVETPTSAAPTAAMDTTTTTTAETTTTTTAEATTATAGAGLELSIVEVTSPVSQGSMATVKAKTAPGAECSIAVMYKTRSTAEGLESKKADAAGNVSWTWKIGPNTSLGPHQITVTASMDGLSVQEKTTFVVE